MSRPVGRALCLLLGHKCRTIYHPQLDASWHECTRCKRGWWNDRLGVTYRCNCTIVEPPTGNT